MFNALCNLVAIATAVNVAIGDWQSAAYGVAALVVVIVAGNIATAVCE